MSGVLGLQPLHGFAGLLTLLQIMALLYFAFVTWRAAAGRQALVFLIVTLAYVALEETKIMKQITTILFPYTNETKNL